MERIKILFAFLLLLAGGAKAAFLVPLYTYDVGEWEKVADMADRGDVIAVINPASGPSDEFVPAVASLIAFLKANDISVLAYVPTGYGERPLEEVVGDVERYKAFYADKGLEIDGIFFDEVGDNESYYLLLEEEARERGFTENWYNAGTFSPLEGELKVVIYEGPCSEMPSLEGHEGAFLCYSYTGEGPVEENYKALGVGYATKDGGDNPWDTVSLLLPELLGMERKGKGWNYIIENGTIYREEGGEKEALNVFGVAWFGFEVGGDYIVHGLWARNWEEMMEHMKRLGFNAIRLPFCTHAVEPWQMVNGEVVDESLNPDMEGIPSLVAMHKIVKKAQELDMYVLLDYHRIGCEEIEELWYTDDFSESNYTETWRWVAYNFKNYDNVIGADLKNEPHGRASWGTLDERDWWLASYRIGKAVLDVAPHWLAFIEGVERTPFDELAIDQYTFWGENLRGAYFLPSPLPEGKVVYSPHVYGPDVYVMPYFEWPVELWPKALSYVWDRHFGLLRNLAIGEFGGRFGEGHPLDDEWQRTFVDYLIAKDVCNFFYWSWNPNSGDTGGILGDDWESVKWAKYWNLRRLMDHCRGGPVLHTVE